MTIIGIDLGGSGSRIAAADGSSATATGPAFAIAGGRADHAAVVRALVHRLGSVEGPVTAVAACAAGLVASGDPETVRDAIAEAWPDAVVSVASDAVAAVAGAWGETGGAVVAAGTGVIAFATDFADVWARSDGWGHILGDDGGAAWIGRRGLAAALRAIDGRPGGSDALLDALRVQGIDPIALPDAVRSAPNPATYLASFARAVTVEAARGDSVALSIVEIAARELADTGLSVMRDGVQSRLALVGGLASEPLIAEAFSARVRERRPGLVVSIDPGTPLDGALRLARLALGESPPSHPSYLVQFPSTASPHPRGAS